MNWIKTKGFFSNFVANPNMFILQMLFETNILVTSLTTSHEIFWTLECICQDYLYSGWRSSTEILGSGKY